MLVRDYLVGAGLRALAGCWMKSPDGAAFRRLYADAEAAFEEFVRDNEYPREIYGLPVSPCASGGEAPTAVFVQVSGAGTFVGFESFSTVNYDGWESVDSPSAVAEAERERVAAESYYRRGCLRTLVENAEFLLSRREAIEGDDELALARTNPVSVRYPGMREPYLTLADLVAIWDDAGGRRRCACGATAFFTGSIHAPGGGVVRYSCPACGKDGTAPAAECRVAPLIASASTRRWSRKLRLDQVLDRLGR